MSMLELPMTSAEPWAFPVVEMPSAPTPKRWTREEYYHLAELGCFQDQRVELIDGEIITLPPQSFGHYWAIDRLYDLLKDIFRPADRYWVRSQGPILASNISEPEPDLAVVRGNRNEMKVHPPTAVLVVEVSVSSLEYDRKTKASLYASIGVPDYWVLDLESRVLEVRRQPVKDASQQFEWRYDEIQVIDAAGSVSPLEMPEAKLAVADMLPPVTA